MKRALTAYEDTNMYGGAHCTNIDAARRAVMEGRDLIVHASHYDGQRYHYDVYHVTDLRITKSGGVVGVDSRGLPWRATEELCRYAMTSQI